MGFVAACLVLLTILGTIAGVPLAEELTGIEAYVVATLKVLLLVVMAGGAVAVFREMIPMARGQARPPAAPVESEGEAQ